METAPTPQVTQPIQSQVGNHPTLPQIQANKIWTKVIPISNLVFLILSVPLVFGLDLMILIYSQSYHDILLNIWITMLELFGLFVGFFLFENIFLKKKFANTKSTIDNWLVFLIIVRDFILLLNFIPLIQLLGLLIGFYVTLPFLIVYAILIVKRFQVVQK